LSHWSPSELSFSHILPVFLCRLLPTSVCLLFAVLTRTVLALVVRLVPILQWPEAIQMHDKTAVIRREGTRSRDVS
jgi:hypothetical protein